ncbi:MAG: hypothetical protein ACK562_12350 [Acidobacteriota bacterium]
MRDEDRSTRLFLAVAGKFPLEILLLAAVASYAAWSNFHPLVRGAIDLALPERVAGWAFDPEQPRTPLEVQLFIDGQFRATQRADQPRPDLVAAGATPGPDHGFNFPIPPAALSAGRHTVEVFVLRPALNGYRTLVPLSNEPKSFSIEP